MIQPRDLANQQFAGRERVLEARPSEQPFTANDLQSEHGRAKSSLEKFETKPSWGSAWIIQRSATRCSLRLDEPERQDHLEMPKVKQWMWSWRLEFIRYARAELHKL